jgi:membrane protease YdiL (CAAX protease family)
MEQEKSAVKKRLVLFVALTFAIAWSIFLSIPLSGLTYGSGTSVVIVMTAMFAPALSSILTRLLSKEGFGDMYLRPHFKGHVKDYLLLYFWPTLLLLLSGAVYFLIFPGSFDPGLTTLKEMLAASGKQGDIAPKVLAAQALVFAAIGPVVNIIPTMGEELGWRGYLLPRLRVFFSDRAALLLSGAIWGIWHLPVIVLGHNYGTDYFGYPWLGILAMTIFCVVLGIIEGYISIKLQSAVPAAMIHSTVNAGAAFPIYLLKGSHSALLGPAITGLFGGIPFIALAVILFFKSDRKKRCTGENEDCSSQNQVILSR